MKVLIDLMHIPHINFLKNAISLLKDKGVEIKVFCLDRGRNISIAREELEGIEVIALGKHRGSFLSIIFEANILRFLLIFKHLLFNRYDLGLSVGGFLTGFGLKLFGKPNLQYYDDPENKKNLYFQRLTSTKLFYPSFFKSEGILNFNALKEWAYLSPKYFKNNNDILKEYDLQEKEYIFIREVNANTTNYVGQSADLIAAISDKFPKGVRVLLSLENKQNINFYPKTWTILNEPVGDIHSLMYYSKVLISSGDSMAREGAMLGVPSIYCGVRDMAANKVMIDKGLLFQLDITKVPDFISEIFNNNKTFIDQDEYRNDLLLEWDDVTAQIVSNVLDFGN